MNARLLIAVAMLAFSSASLADAYKCLGPDKKPYFTDQPCRYVLNSSGSGDPVEERRRAMARSAEIAETKKELAAIDNAREKERQAEIRQRQLAAAAQQAAYERQAEVNRQQQLIDEVRALRAQQAAQAAQPQRRQSCYMDQLGYMNCN